MGAGAAAIPPEDSVRTHLFDARILDEPDELEAVGSA
jgi:hypothetical protein